MEFVNADKIFEEEKKTISVKRNKMKGNVK